MNLVKPVPVSDRIKRRISRMKSHIVHKLDPTITNLANELHLSKATVMEVLVEETNAHNAWNELVNAAEAYVKDTL